jgi:hypothetical protein
MITIGTRFYPAAAESERRQQRSRDSLLRLPGAHTVNLQFADETFRPEGFDTRAVLRRDSRTATGGGRVRKPMIAEMFDALAAVAAERGDRYFVYLNADIEVAPAAIDRIARGDRDGYAFCRVDLAAATREPGDVLLLGLDMFAIDTGWWARERRRFRDYIAGEALWDNVYAAVLASHGRAAIVDEAPGIYHERHAASWGGGLYAAYNGCLAALDAPYFTRWAIYHAALEEARATGVPLDRDRVMRETFSAPVLRGLDYPKHAARSLRARLRYAIARPRLAREE